MRSIGLPASLLLLTACWSTHSGRKVQEIQADTSADVQRRAAFDLQCPSDQTTLSKLDTMSYGARGCGRQARYLRACMRCQWMLDGTVDEIIVK